MNTKSQLLILALFFVTLSVNAQNKLCRVWWNQEKTSKVKVFLATDGKYYGKIIWLKGTINSSLFNVQSSIVLFRTLNIEF